jgi:hypothetical protein
MFSQDVHFLFRGEVTSGSFHFGLHSEPTLYRISATFPFPSEARHPHEATIIELVKSILTAKKENANADITKYDQELDQLVYALYGLTSEEIAIVEGSAK